MNVQSCSVWSPNKPTENQVLLQQCQQHRCISHWGQSLRFTVVGMRSGLGLGLGVMIGAHYFSKRRGSTEVQKSRNPWVSKMLTDPSQCLYPDTWPRLTPIHLDAWTMRIANDHTRSSSSLFSGGTHHLRLTQTDFLKSKCSLKCCWFALHAET